MGFLEIVGGQHNGDALAIELAPRGILVNAVAPGIIETDMTTEIREKYMVSILNKIKCMDKIHE
jgi:NAD(P)-dependent dehydrogenase (short-subunit alcohol dehydrogenase family)